MVTPKREVVSGLRLCWNDANNAPEMPAMKAAMHEVDRLVADDVDPHRTGQSVVVLDGSPLEADVGPF